MFARVENGVTKLCQKFRWKNRKNAIFWSELFHFFEQDRLLFARVDIGVTEFPTKTVKEEEEKLGSDIFSKVGVRIPFSMANGEFPYFFGRGKTYFFGWAPFFGAKDVCYIQNKVAK